MKSWRFLTTQGMTASLPTATVMLGTGLRNSGPGRGLEEEEDAEAEAEAEAAAVASAEETSNPSRTTAVWRDRERERGQTLMKVVGAQPTRLGFKT